MVSWCCCPAAGWWLHKTTIQAREGFGGGLVVIGPTTTNYCSEEKGFFGATEMLQHQLPIIIALSLSLSLFLGCCKEACCCSPPPKVHSTGCPFFLQANSTQHHYKFGRGSCRAKTRRRAILDVALHTMATHTLFLFICSPDFFLQFGNKIAWRHH